MFGFTLAYDPSKYIIYLRLHFTMLRSNVDSMAVLCYTAVERTAMHLHTVEKKSN